MNSKIKFSIAIPAYKATYLKECISSILSQTYKNFEVIVLNDASPEDLDSIVYSFEDPHIRYYKNDLNVGAVDVVDNWNKCLECSTGDYLICMGDDDKLKECCLFEYAIAIEKNCFPNVIHGRTELIDENSNVTNILEARDGVESVYSHIWYRWRGRWQFVGDFCYKVEKLREYGGFMKLPLAWASDDITANILAQNLGIVNVNTPVFQYRMSSLTISSSSSEKIKMKAILLEEEWYRGFLNKTPTSNKDLLLYQFILQSIDGYFIKKRVDTVIQSLVKNKCDLFYWLKNRIKYKMSIKMILYSLLMSVIFGQIDSYKKELKK